MLNQTSTANIGILTPSSDYWAISTNITMLTLQCINVSAQLPTLALTLACQS